MFPTTGILDNFNRADEDPITGNWDGTGDWFVQSQQAGRNNVFMYWNTVFGADQEAYVTLPVLPFTDSAMVLYLRTTNPLGSKTAYKVGIQNDGSNIFSLYMTRVIAGTETAFFFGQSFATMANGDKFGASVVGNSIYAWYYTSGAWSLKYTFVDSNNYVTGPGYIGAEPLDGAARIDDFGGGVVVVPGPPLATPMKVGKW